MPRPTNHRLDDVLRVGMEMDVDMQAASSGKRSADEYDNDGAGSSSASAPSNSSASKSARPNPPPAFDPMTTTFELFLKPPIAWNSERYYNYNSESPINGPDLRLTSAELQQANFRALSADVKRLYDTQLQPARFLGTLDEITSQLANYEFEGKPLLNKELFFTALSVLNDIVFDKVAYLNADSESVKLYKPNLRERAMGLFEKQPVRNTRAFLNQLRYSESDSESDKTLTLARVLFVLNALTATENYMNIEGFLDEMLDREDDNEPKVYELWFQLQSIVDTIYDVTEQWPELYREEIATYLGRLSRATDPRPSFVLYANQMADPAMRDYMDRQELINVLGEKEVARMDAEEEAERKAELEEKRRIEGTDSEASADEQEDENTPVETQ